MVVVESLPSAKTPAPASGNNKKSKNESKNSFPVKVSAVGLLRNVSSEYELRKLLLSLLLEMPGVAPTSLGFAVSAVVAAFAGQGASEDEITVRFTSGDILQAIQESEITSLLPKFAFPPTWTGVAEHDVSLSPLPEDGAVPAEVLDKGGLLAVRYLEDWLDEDGAIEGYASWTTCRQSPPSKQPRADVEEEEEAGEEGQTSLNSTIPTPWPEDGEKSIIEQVSWLE